MKYEFQYRKDNRKNEDTGKEEDVKLFYSTITDNVGITCGEQEVFLTQDQGIGVPYAALLLYERNVA